MPMSTFNKPGNPCRQSRPHKQMQDRKSQRNKLPWPGNWIRRRINEGIMRLGLGAITTCGRYRGRLHVALPVSTQPGNPTFQAVSCIVSGDAQHYDSISNDRE